MVNLVEQMLALRKKLAAAENLADKEIRIVGGKIKGDCFVDFPANL
jgi:hypothetical protein